MILVDFKYSQHKITKFTVSNLMCFSSSKKPEIVEKDKSVSWCFQVANRVVCASDSICGAWKGSGRRLMSMLVEAVGCWLPPP
jgi:hypothetical protein